MLPLAYPRLVVDRYLRPAKARALAPLAQACRALPPDRLTAAGLVVGLAAAGAAAVGSFGLALALWLASRLLDGLDGEVARLSQERSSEALPPRARHLQAPLLPAGTLRGSDRGGFLDLVADVTVYAALTLGLAAGAAPLAGDPGAIWPLAAFALAAYYVNITALLVTATLLEKRGLGSEARCETTSLTIPSGLIEGTETIVLLSLALVVPQYATFTLSLIALLVALTALQRVVWSLRHLPGPS
jgi:phosphatidylglycerophosphate synthase